MPAARRNAITEFFFRIHPWIYRKTNGRLLGRLGNAPILLLETIGRKSGLTRTNGLMYLNRGNTWAVAASWAGEPKHPVWYLNLMAHPDVTIQVGDRRVRVRARELEGVEREIVWQEIVAQDPSFAEYEKRTRGAREIPVIVFEPRDTEETSAPDHVHVMYGMSCSYFTGKLEAYLQTKGLPFRSVELDRTQLRECGRRTGIAQFPCIETPDGEWITDTTAIMEHFEGKNVGPTVRPDDDAAAFCSLLFEDLFDEWYWRPALYYRWAFAEDSRLMSNWIARTLVRDMRMPLFIRRLLVLRRQRIVYMKKDGVTKQTATTLETLYMDSLNALEAIFAKRPFLFGDRPCEADFGLFGPFFRHFFCDPTPGALMRKHAPQLSHWVTRLWSTRPRDLAETEAISGVPDDLGFFFEMCANDYLPYLDANATAVAAGRTNVSYVSGGASWEIPPAPYRAECFNELKRRFAALTSEAKRAVCDRLPQAGIDLLEKPMTRVERQPGILGRLGQPVVPLG